jgi:rhodanese-related sulfurtransferase
LVIAIYCPAEVIMAKLRWHVCLILGLCGLLLNSGCGDMPVVPITPSAAATPTVPPETLSALRAVLAGLEADPEYGTIMPGQLRLALARREVVLLDLRDTREITWHVAGAIHLPVRELLQQRAALPEPSHPIVVYSTAGHRASFAMVGLRLIGYADVRTLDGGMLGWQASGVQLAPGLPDALPAAVPAAVTPAALDAAVGRILERLPPGYYSITPAHLAERMLDREPPLVLDIRPADERVLHGWINGSLSLPSAEVLDHLERLPPRDASIVVVSDRMHRASVMTMVLRLAGYRDVVTLEGGLNSWTAAGYGLVR